MKLFAALFILLSLSTSAFAEIRPAETFSYVETWSEPNKQGQTRYVEYTINDQKDDQVFLWSVRYYHSEGFTQKQWHKREDVDGSLLFGPDKIQETCALKMGQVETVHIKNHTLQTCKVEMLTTETDSDQKIIRIHKITWYGPVLNGGIARVVEEREFEGGRKSTHTKELVSIYSPYN